MSYTIPRKTLRISGAPATKFSKPYPLPKRPWGTEADEAFYSLTSTAGPDGKVPDWSNEKLATDAGGPIVWRLDAPDVTDEVLLTYARHPDQGIRQAAANAIGRKSGDSMILQLLRDKDPRVRNAGGMRVWNFSRKFCSSVARSVMSGRYSYLRACSLPMKPYSMTSSRTTDLWRSGAWR